MSQRRVRLSLVTVAVAAGVVATAPAGTAAPAGTVAPTGAAEPTVTLLTGDKVTVGGPSGVDVRAAEGREHISFRVREDLDGHTHVIPSDAVGPLSSGKLDPRLFDVSELVRVGYDDASRDRLPLIVDYPGRTPRMAGVQVSRELPGMSAAAVSVEPSADFWATTQNAERIWLDGPVRATLDQSVPQIGAPSAWGAGHTGAGTTVAVLDTGIDAEHPDLAGAVVGAQNFSDSDTTDDRRGHGTHVASTITGNDAKYQGVAPEAELLNGKVLDDEGNGQESGIIAAMEWATASGADVVNMSLGTEFPSDGTDPVSQAVNRLTAETGTLFVVAAGNEGGMVGSPAAADAALTVGAVDRDDELADFSNRGRDGGGLKPEITAPGLGIVAAKVGGGHLAMSGTSMATPHVAGAAAVLAGQHPDWAADQLKTALMGSAKPNGAVTEQGAGRVDVAKASAATVFASVTVIDHGTVQWPHHDDEPIEKTITYTNTGAEPVTLDFAADVPGAPQGMFTFAPAQLTVPAGGQASTTVTTDTRVAAPDGAHSGAITATGDGQSVRTLITVTCEVESYDVTVQAVDRNGAPAVEYHYSLVDVDNPRSYSGYDPSVVRVPKGEYLFDGSILTPSTPGRFKYTEFFEPVFMVTGDREVVVDARQGKPVNFTVDKPNAKVGDGLFRFETRGAWGSLSSTLHLGNFDDHLFMPSTTAKKDRVIFTAEAHLAEWNGKSFDGSPYMYHVRRVENGALPQEFQWHYGDSKLAKVRAEYAMASPGVVGVRQRFLTVPLPGTLTEYYTPNEPWDGQFAEATDPDNYDYVSVTEQVTPRSFPLGRTPTDRWNTGVFGPAFPSSDEWYFAARLGNQLRIGLPLVTDQNRSRMTFPVGDGATTLLRDGAVVGESPVPGAGAFEVGPERAKYTLRTSMDRSSFARLSTQVSAEWTFASAHVAGDPARLPLLAVRFAPNLDVNNAAPAGRPFVIPVYVQRNGAELGRVNTPTVEVSYDDGATWQAAPVSRHRGEWRTVVDHPAAAKFVSLRSSVTDPDGDSQRQTIIRAYALA